LEVIFPDQRFLDFAGALLVYFLLPVALPIPTADAFLSVMRRAFRLLCGRADLNRRHQRAAKQQS
ncbi:MAG TPA: hypothetical protein VK657_13770, partial [Terriglobales bacterium]|nr:hypothetical protein [Terriglobales bacterium]